MAAGDIYENGTHGGSANNTHNHYIPESFDLDNVYFTGKVSNTTEDDIANLRTRVLKRERVFFITPTDHPGTTIYIIIIKLERILHIMKQLILCHHIL